MWKYILAYIIIILIYAVYELRNEEFILQFANSSIITYISVFATILTVISRASSIASIMKKYWGRFLKIFKKNQMNDNAIEIEAINRNISEIWRRIDTYNIRIEKIEKDIWNKNK